MKHAAAHHIICEYHWHQSVKSHYSHLAQGVVTQWVRSCAVGKCEYGNQYACAYQHQPIPIALAWLHHQQHTQPHKASHHQCAYHGALHG